MTPNIFGHGPGATIPWTIETVQCVCRRSRGDCDGINIAGDKTDKQGQSQGSGDVI